MKVYSVESDGKLTACSLDKKRKMVIAQVGEDDLETVLTRVIVELDPDLENDTMDVDIRVPPGMHIPETGEDGETDLDVISEILGESIAEVFDGFEPGTIRIKPIEEEGSAFDKHYETGALEGDEIDFEEDDEDIYDIGDEVGSYNVPAPSQAPAAPVPEAPSDGGSGGISERRRDVEKPQDVSREGQ